MKLETPTGWRKGQTMFNFLEYLRRQGIPTNQSHRLADSFHITDAEWDAHWKKFMEVYGKKDIPAPEN